MPLPRSPRAALSLARGSHTPLQNHQPRTLTSRQFQAQHVSQRAQPQRTSQGKHDFEPPSELKISSMDKLGVSRTVKTVVIVFVAIIGTVETVFWVRSGWRYFYHPASTEEGSEETGEKE